MRVNTKNADRIELDEDEIDEVEDFAYLGSNISKDGGSDQDIRVRIGKVITNEELWTTTEQERINIQIRRRKWGWIGHTLRKTNCNVTKQALRWNPQGKRSRGRPRNSWRRTVDDEASKAGYTWTQIERIAQNRTRWRAVVSVDLCSMGSERV
ncbi:uncharacterized protein LOC144633428 [Oculina patagonica]